MANQSGRFFPRLRRVLIGRPRDLFDKSIFHSLALVPVLAWVGLGSDGLSSCAYGPEEAFKAIGAQHTYLGVALAVAVAGTVWLLALAYGNLISAFPTGRPDGGCCRCRRCCSGLPAAATAAGGTGWSTGRRDGRWARAPTASA